MYHPTEMSPAYRTAASPMYPNGMSPMNTTDMPAAGPAEKALWARVANGNNNNGRDRVGWTQETWDRIDRAVHDEMCRVGIGRRLFLDFGQCGPVNAGRAVVAAHRDPRPPQDISLR